ncbi:hypothetical protein DERF_002012, partial [Dermatophagoides farinae]
KYTAYPSGELHVRDVDEHDARRTYQCAIYTSIINSFNNTTTQQQQPSLSNNQQQISQPSLQTSPNQQRPLAESTFAQIILSGM